MNFATLKSEVATRGFDYLLEEAPTRVARFVNLAYQEICDAEDWPFMQAVATGVSPLTIADLGVIEGVSYNQVPLAPADRRQLSDDFGDLSLSGAAVYYFPTTGPAVSTFPVGELPLTVRYWRVPVDLSADADTPILPARFHELIVLGALRRAYLETGNPEGAAAVDQEWQRGVQLMRERVLNWHRDGVPQGLVTVDHGDA